MADFRKWLVAFAVVAILLAFAPTALAVTTAPPLSCNTDASTPKSVRGEGVTELNGDIVLTCTGGSPTQAGQIVLLSNIHVQLQVPITSRTLGTVAVGNSTSTQMTSEAVLMIDEPFPQNPFPGFVTPIQGSPLKQVGCIAAGGQVASNLFMVAAAGQTVGTCEIFGDGFGATTYAGGSAAVPAPQYNTFQGIATTNLTTGYATVDFLGVPIDPPGSANERIIRITNIRGDMTNALATLGSNPSGVPIYATISVSGQQSLTVTDSTLVTAYVFQGLVPGAVKSVSLPQCLLPSGSPSITFAEGFASSFKTAQIVDTDAYTGGVLTALKNDEDFNFQPQNIPFLNYYTETGFTPTLSAGSLMLASTKAAPNTIGVADTGTRFLITVSNLQNGVTLTFPAAVSGGSNSPNLELWIVPNANADGTGGTPSPSSGVALAGSWTATGAATSAFVVYEVVADDPNQIEQATITPTVAWKLSNPPALGLGNASSSTAGATVSFAPLEADASGFVPPGSPLPTNNGKVNTAKIGSLPRFKSTAPGLSNLLIIYPCSCNLLFPWVVQGQGTQFETGLVVANTSADPASSSTGYANWTPTDQTGATTLWFFGTRTGSTAQIVREPHPAGTAADPPIIVPAGCALEYILSYGSALNCAAPLLAGITEGSISTAPGTGFVGYIIATSTFQYCHGVAYVNDINDPYHGAYYEAIEMDTPFFLNSLTRTGQWGEMQGH